MHALSIKSHMNYARTHSIWLCLLVFDVGTYCSDFGDRTVKLRVLSNNLLPIYMRNFDNRLSFINTRSVWKARAKIIYLHNYCGSVIVHHHHHRFIFLSWNTIKLKMILIRHFRVFFSCATGYVWVSLCQSTVFWDKIQ